MTQDYLKTDKGVQEFNDFIEHRSYVEGFFPTQVDIAVLESIAKAPSSKTPHARRWYNHIFTFSDDEKKKFPGEKVAPKVFGPRIVIKGSENELGPFKPLDLDDEDILPNVTTDAVNLKENTCAKPKPKSQPESKPADDDDDVDLFGSDEEEDAEAAKIREERLKAYSDKKSKKAAIIAKSSILLDVKPWDDETDMAEMEHSVRTIEMEGLVWGASKLVPLAYGIKKLQILCVVEDEKVSVDDLVDKIQEFEDFVQSVDIAAFNKI